MVSKTYTSTSTTSSSRRAYRPADTSFDSGPRSRSYSSKGYSSDITSSTDFGLGPGTSSYSRSSYTPRSYSPVGASYGSSSTSTRGRSRRRAASTEPDYVSPYATSTGASGSDRYVVGYASVTTKSKPTGTTQYVNVEPVRAPPRATSTPPQGFAPHLGVPRTSRKYEYDTSVDTSLNYEEYVPPSSLRRPRSASVDRTSSISRASSVTRTAGRAPSMGRASSATKGFSFHTVDGYKTIPGLSKTGSKRAASVSRFTSTGDVDVDIDYSISRPVLKKPRASSVCRYTGLDYEVNRPIGYKSYASKSIDTTRDRHHVVHDMEVSRDGEGDISRLVLEPGQPFNPDNIRVIVLPSGKKGVIYTRTTQTGHTDNPQLANDEIEKIIQRTQHLAETMNTLEKFVKLNRNLFPDDTLIYQTMLFFKLSEEELLHIGSSPEAEVYGCTIRERLVIPHGTDVTGVLRRFKGASDYEVEYASKEGIQRRASNVQQGQMPPQFTPMDTIRKNVETEYELESSRRPQRQYRETGYDKHKHEYTQKFFVPTDVDYDSIYSHRSSVDRSLPSDQESGVTRSSVPSGRKKRFDSSPQFMSKLRPKKCYEGQTIRFNASVSGLPLPDVTWLKGTRVINDDSRYHFSNNYGLVSMEIPSVTKQDQDLYTIKAANVEGEIACSAPLEIEVIDISSETLGEPRKPYFLIEPHNTWAEVGQKAVFEAQATGRPLPTCKWQKDSVNISDGEHYRVYGDEHGNTKLVVLGTSEADSGLYFCIAENSTGKCKSTATLRVVDKGQLIDGEKPVTLRRRSMSRESTPTFDRPIFTSREGAQPGTKPWFIQVPPSEMTVYEGDSLTLRCVVDGDPKPVVTWFKGVRELQYTERTRVVVEGDHHIMQLKSVLETDPGEYLILAKNSLGKIRTSVYVNVKPRPQTEEEEAEYERTRQQYPEYEYEVVTTKEQANVAPRFVKKLPREKEVRVGDDLEMEVKIEEAPAPEYITDVRVVRKEVKKTEEEATTVEEKADLLAQKILADAMDEVKDEGGVAPEFVTPLKDKKTKVGSILKLSIKLNECQPAPHIHWFKGDADITDDDRYEIFAEDDTFNLEMCDVEEGDSGHFSCLVFNTQGTAKSRCVVTIGDAVVAPLEEETPAEQAPVAEAPKPAEEAPVATEEVQKPAEEAPKPAEEAPVAAEEAPVAAEEAPKPAEEAPVAAEETPKPAEEAPVAAEEAPKPSEEAPVAVEEAPKPAEEAPVADEEAPKPAEEAPVAAEEAPKPAEEAPVAAEEAPKPAEEAPVSEDAPKPAEEAAKPAEETPVEESTTADEETTTAAEDTTTADESEGMTSEAESTTEQVVEQVTVSEETKEETVVLVKEETVESSEVTEMSTTEETTTVEETKKKKVPTATLR